MSERYYWQNDLSRLPVIKPGNLVELAGDEAHHLTRVMRQKVGDMVVLFDGEDREYPAEITETRKGRITLRILEVRNVDTESPRQVTVAVALPKGDRQKWLVEKLTELGCHRLIPLQTERAVTQCSDQVVARLRRQVLEATKQCNRSRLMAVSPEKDIAGCMTECALADVDGDAGGDDTAGDIVGLIAHPLSDGDFGQLPLSELTKIILPKRVLVLIGPEGGFTAGEAERAVKLGFRSLDLGPRILRVETAAMMLATLLTSLP